jgi:hypothetical protein
LVKLVFGSVKLLSCPNWIFGVARSEALRRACEILKENLTHRRLLGMPTNPRTLPTNSSEEPKANMQTLGRVFLATSLWLLASATGFPQAATPAPEIEKTMTALLDAASGRNQRFRLRAVVQVPIDGQPQDMLVDVLRNGQDFDLSLVHSEYTMTIRRRPEGTALALPKHKVVYIGTGDPSIDDHLGFEGLAARLISNHCAAGRYAPIMLSLQPQVVLKMAQSSMGAKIENEGRSLRIAEMQIRVTMPGQVSATINGAKLRAGVQEWTQALPELDDWPQYEVHELDRVELERTVVRGLRRATEITSPGPVFNTPSQEVREVANGKLTWISGQRVVSLSGSPEQIGQAHGQLLGFEISTCIDSAIHTYGLIQTMKTGQWFPAKLNKRLSEMRPHIPERLRAETQALSAATGQPLELIESLNLITEWTSSTSFGLTGSATIDGNLYHGHIQDGMPSAGMQDCTTIFMIAPEGKKPFISLGYAGLASCCAGLNQAQLSATATYLPGDNTWNGIPTSMLLRAILEDCSTLEEAADRWKDVPHASDAFCILADGKTRKTIGIATRSQGFEIIWSGSSHARFGQGIADTVLASSSGRPDKLREVIAGNLGQFDNKSVAKLISLTWSTEPNLQNVLLMPVESTATIFSGRLKSPTSQPDQATIHLPDLLAAP